MPALCDHCDVKFSNRLRQQTSPTASRMLRRASITPISILIRILLDR